MSNVVDILFLWFVLLLLNKGIPEEKWVATCVLIDKLEKVPVSALKDDLAAIGLSEDTVQQLLKLLTVRSSTVV